MRILIVSASPRRKGVTSTLLEEIQRHIASKHVVEAVSLHKLKMKPCIACLKCRPDKRCVLPEDDAHALADKLRLADLLIIGCPVYWGNMPGPLKIFFDRNVPLFEYAEARSSLKVPKPQLEGKRAILVLSSASPFPYNLLRSQSRGAIQALKTVLKSGGIKIGAVLNVSDSYAFERKKERYLRRARNIGLSI